MTVREILKMMQADGWFQVRQEGSHRPFHHASKKGTVTVAGKPSKTLDHKLVKSILDQAGLEQGGFTCTE